MDRPLSALKYAIVAGLAGLIGTSNPIDVVGRGKFVRALQTRSGEKSAVVCLPATADAELPALRAELPDVVQALERAGAQNVVFDLDELPDEALATSLPMVIGLDTAAEELPPVPDRARIGHRAKRTRPPTVVVGIPHAVEIGGRRVASLAAEALAQHRGAPPPAYVNDQILIGDQAFPLVDDHHAFMPYEIPFLHWSKRDTWEDVAGRTVFIGACRLDRELTRFGRQPGTIAHAEQFETMRDGVTPRSAPAGVNVLVALVTNSIASRARAWSRLGPVLVGVAMVGLLAWFELSGVWFGLTGVVGAALVQAVRR